MRYNIFALAILAAAASSQFVAMPQQTKILSADKHNEYGLTYSLPVTSLRFEVTARRTVSVAGPYRQYAKKYIGTDKVVAADSEQWEIVSIKALPYGTPDSKQSFLMQLKPGALTYICVADDGMLRAINTEAKPEILPLPQADTPMSRNLNIDEYLQYVDEDFIASQSSAKQAQMLSESLMEIRDAKVQLTRGTAETMPTDGRQLELMLQSLAHQEQTMTEAFIGASASQSVTRTFSVTPDAEGRSILFRMSDFAGIVDADDLSGDPVYLSVKIIAQPQIPVDAKGEEKRIPKDAVIYRIPGEAQFSLSLKGNTIWSGNFECAQFGVNFGLQPALFTDKKERSWATFNPATGALQQLGIVTE